jgi:hypothetical protein
MAKHGSYPKLHHHTYKLAIILIPPCQTTGKTWKNPNILAYPNKSSCMLKFFTGGVLMPGPAQQIQKKRNF